MNVVSALECRGINQGVSIVYWDAGRVTGCWFDVTRSGVMDIVREKQREDITLPDYK